MSWMARLLRRWGFVRLSDYGLSVAPDGTLVPLAHATAEMGARVAPEFDLHATQMPANNFDVSRLIAEPAKLLEDGSESAARPTRKSLLMWSADEPDGNDTQETQEDGSGQDAPIEAAEPRRALPLPPGEVTGMTRAAPQSDQAPAVSAAPDAAADAGASDDAEAEPEEANWDAMLARARERAEAQAETGATADDPPTEADWEAVIAAAKEADDHADDLEYMPDEDITMAEDDVDAGEETARQEAESDWENVLAAAKQRAVTKLLTPVAPAPRQEAQRQPTTDDGWEQAAFASTESAESAVSTALDNLAVGDATQVTPAPQHDEWESKMAELQAKSEHEEMRRKRAAREAKRLARRSVPVRTTRTLQAMVSRTSGNRRSSRLAAGTEPPPPRMSTTPGLGASDATKVMRKRAPAAPAAARPASGKPAPLPRLSSRLGGDK